MEDQATMATRIRQFLAERADIKELGLLKDKPKKNQKTGSEIGGINARLTALIEFSKTKLVNQQKAEYLTLRKAKKGKDQTDLDFQRSKYTALKVLAIGVDSVDAHKVSDEYQKSSQKITSEHEPEQWLSVNCKNASGVSFATHVAKLTHSSIKGASNLYDASESVSNEYLTTSALASKVEDSALDNAAYSAVAALLKIGDSERTLGDLVVAGDTSAFEELSSKPELVTSWISELKKAFDSERKSSHILAKQVFWPTSEGHYHLLMPIKSSSFAQTLHEKFSAFFDESNSNARKQRDAKKYSSVVACYYPNKAILKVTASNHTNASSLNGKRGGRLNLLSCAPPAWQTKSQAPTKQKSLFDYQVQKQAAELADELRKLLVDIKLKRVSMKEPDTHKTIVSLVDAIADIALDYAASIRSLTVEAGWSKASSLRKSHKYLLDIHLDDDEFQTERNTGAWQLDVAQDFGEWLNARLKYKTKLQLGPIQAALWRTLFQEKLRLFLAEMEVNL